MLRRRVTAIATSGLLIFVVVNATPAEAKPATPSKITSLRAAPGPGAGQVIFQWASAGRNTDYFLLETGLTSFSPSSSSSLPRHGRQPAYFRIGRTDRSFTLSAAEAGAHVDSGRHLYFRLFAVNQEGSATTTKAYPYLRAVLPRGMVAKKPGTPVRAATFNVRTARARSDKRHWMVRIPDVAQEIAATEPGVVAIQELSPGRVDGKNGSTLKVGRQTTSLTGALAKIGYGRYKLVRSTSYVKSGTRFGSQGARILYDSSKFTLESSCPEKTGKKYYNASCMVKLPQLAGDSENDRRAAAYAELKSRSTDKRFLVISAHLDQRHSSSAAKEQQYNQLRRSQVATILGKIKSVNPGNLPVIFGGDINSWQNNKIGHAPHDLLVANGYYDTVAATRHVNLAYPTVNHYDRVLKPKSIGIGTRIDVVMVKGSRGSNLYYNKMLPIDSTRPSDHNLVFGDIVL